MDRSPPEAVRRILRKEVNYGCPVPGCGRPVLEFHHFDPTWREREHMDPVGMIALCQEHHDAADNGAFAVADLREMKQRPNPLTHIKQQFPWTARACLIRIGGCYAADRFRLPLRVDPRWNLIRAKHFIGGSIIATGFPDSGKSLLEIRNNEAGLKTLNLTLLDRKSNVIAAVEENTLVASAANTHDLSIPASSTGAKIWIAERQIGVEFHFSRKTIAQIERQLQEDEVRSLRKVDKTTPPEESWLCSRATDADYDQLIQLRTEAEVSEFARTNWKPITSTLVRWHSLRLREADNLIPCYDVINCCLWDGMTEIVIRNGIASEDLRIDGAFLRL